MMDFYLEIHFSYTIIYMKRHDFAIVGAGIAGASAAARLGGQASVLLLEQEASPGYHSTGRSAALYSALYGNDTITAITRASRPFFDAPPEGFCEYPLLSQRGVLFAGSEADAQAIAEIACLPLAQRMDTSEALKLVPILAAECAAHCAWEPDAFDVDVHALHQGFLRMARRSGADLVCRAGVTALTREQDGWRISTTNGDFVAKVLINAAGAWADRVARLAGARALGIQPLRRTAMIIDAGLQDDVRHWPAVIAADESWYLKPDAGLILASPADETPTEPCDAQPEELDIAICADRIESRTRLQIRRIVRSWAGLRSFAPDRTPVVGYDPQAEGFFWLAALGGYGVQTSPALSEIAAALALRQKIPMHILDEGFDVSAVLPQRFS
jgi:D-arginine dehydrogenase